tara:strand:+ start:1147 stop:1272 length:126 start_codon:yes stop_codon:yes gene_type:complete
MWSENTGGRDKFLSLELQERNKKKIKIKLFLKNIILELTYN